MNVEEQERIARKFRYTENIEFGFNDRALFMTFEDYNIIISLDNITEYIALFERFKTENTIFDGKYTQLKNVPAFKDVSAGNTLKYSRTFEQDGKVVLNYYIKYNGEMENEIKYSKAIDFAISKINEMIKADTKMINENYNGDNLILYSGEFDIILGKNEIISEEKVKYNQYLNTGIEFVTFNFNPDVVEVKKDDLQYIKNNMNKAISSYSCNNYFTEIGYYDDKSQQWVLEYKYELPKYDMYYNQLRSYYFSNNGSYYSSTFNDYYLTLEDNKLIYRNDLVDYLIKDKEQLVQAVYDNSPNIWNFLNINRYNYLISLEDDGDIDVSFPYTGSYTDYSTKKIVYYDAKTYFSLSNNSINNNDYSRKISITDYTGVT